MQQSVSALIIHFRSPEHTRNLVADLLEYSRHLLLEIIIVENGGIPAAIEITDDRIRYLSLPVSVGYAEACNTGARVARGRYLLFLNDDLSCRSEWLLPLLRHFERDASLGLIAPRLTYRDARFQLSWGSDPSLLEEFHERRRQQQARIGAGSAYSRREEQSSIVRDVDWVTGAVMLCSRSAFEQVCGFDQAFPFYYEDIDLCRRMRSAGYRIRYDPSATVIHFLGGSSAASDPRARARYLYGKVRYYARHNGFVSFLILKLYLAAASFRYVFHTQVEQNPTSPPSRFAWWKIPFRPSGPRCDSRPT